MIVNARRTNLLLILLLVAALAATFSWSRLGNRRDDALAAEQDLAQCRAYLAEMDAAGAASPAAQPLAAGVSPTNVNARLRDAAAAAGAAEKLTSIEPGNTETVGDSTELSVFLHFEPITLRELVTFLHQLSAGGGTGMRAKSLELEAPAGAEQGDAWVADVAIGYRGGSEDARAELR
jgi:hypothetical protein